MSEVCGKVVDSMHRLTQISGSRALFSCGPGSQLLTRRRQDVGTSTMFGLDRSILICRKHFHLLSRHVCRFL